MTWFVVDRAYDDRIVAGPYAIKDTAERVRASMALHPAAGQLDLATATQARLFDDTPYSAVAS